MSGSTPRRPRATRGRIGRMLQAIWAARDRPALAWLSTALLVVAVAGLAGGLAPLALKQMVDHLAEPAPERPARLVGWTAAYLGALLCQRACEQAQAYAYGRGELRLTRRLAARAFAHMLNLPLRFHLDAKSGASAQALSEGILGVRLILTHLAVTVAPVAIQLAVAGAVMILMFGAVSGLAFLAALGVYAAVFASGIVGLDAPARAMSAAQIDAAGLTADGLMNVETLKIFTAERRFAARYDAALGARERQWRVFLARRLGNGLLVATIFGAALAVLLLLAGQRVGRGALTIGAFVLLNTYVLQLVRPLEMLGFAARDIGQGLAYLSALLEILDQPGESDARGDAGEPFPEGPAELLFEGVDFAYDDARPTLQGITFRAAPGATLAIVGPSGAGKSSLLRLALRLYAPSAGRILLDGQPIADLPLAALRGQMALVSQDTILLNDTIAANIGLAIEGAQPDAIAAAAEAARLSDLLARLPDGLQTEVGERGLRLSGGEKQRVSIARASLKRARLVLFDEATAALDAVSERAVWAGMDALAQGATRLVITHRLATARSADEILVLERGRIVERGSHAALLMRGGAYAALWAAQAQGEISPPAAT